MDPFALTHETELTPMTCGECGVAFALPAKMLAALRDNEKTFYCPNGCQRVFRVSEKAKLEKQLVEANGRANANAARASSAERRAQMHKCPHCPRTYVQHKRLLTHMKKVHSSTKKLAKDAGPSAHNTRVN